MNINYLLLFLSSVVYVHGKYGHDVGANIPPLAYKYPIFTDLGAPDTTKAVHKRPILSKTKCGVRADSYDNRIVGGEIASPGEYPWLISIQAYPDYSPKHICGGAVLNNKWVITAGHCMEEIDASNLGIVAGEYNLRIKEGHEQYRRIDLIVTRDFDPKNFARDLALLRMDRPFVFNKWVSPICLPYDDEVFQGDGIIAGWGRTSEYGVLPENLYKADIPLVDVNTCKKPYADLGYDNYFSGCQLCAGVPGAGKDACQGDSGGPMLCKAKTDNTTLYLCGVVSWGIGCARPEFSGVYTQVSCHSDWIYSVITNKDNILGIKGKRTRKRRPFFFF